MQNSSSVLPPSPPGRQAQSAPRSRSIARRTSFMLVGALATGLIVVGTGTASAVPPDFPNNILVFPNRDFITIEGFQDHIGEVGTVEVTRPGVGLIGSAKGTVAAGDVAFEINHPGGYCWGAGTGVNVTPDIIGGDLVTLKFGGQSVGDTTVADAAVTGIEYIPGSTTMKVVGHLGAAVNPVQLEQRVVNPGLRTTAVNRRDVLAVPGPLTPAPKGGYSSSLEVTGQTFTATYEFLDATVAATAATGGGERIMAWQVQDADANRQGLTIGEFGELGGPGMGGCPNGPLSSGPVGPTNVSATSINGVYKLNWTPAVAVPGTPAITGYQVSAVSQTVSGSEQGVIGKRIDGVSAKSTTLTGLTDPDYDIEIVSVSSSGLTFPPVHVLPVVDVQKPIVTASPAGGSYPVAQTVTLTSNEPNTDIYYTTDPGLTLVEGDSVSPDAVHYTGPFVISDTSTLQWVGFDVAGNLSTDEAAYTITNTPAPLPPVLAGEPVVGTGSVTVTWAAGDPLAEITGYQVQAYNSAGTAFGAVQTLPATALSATINGLTAAATYTVQVSARNGTGLGAPVTTAPFTIPGSIPVTANAGADQQVIRNATATVKLPGASTGAGVTYQWQQVLTGAGDPDKVTLINAGTSTASFVYPLYKFPMTNNALTFRLTVTDGTTTSTDDVKVTATPDRVTIATAKFKAGDFRITGSSSTIGATITVRAFNNPAVVLGQVLVTAAAAPATGGVYDLRIRTNIVNPGRIYADSSFGGTAGPFTVS